MIMEEKVTHNKETMLLCGKRVKECREERGYTQAELIEKIEHLPENNGKTRNEKHLSAVERGERRLSIEYARLISRVLKVREDYLLGYGDFKTGSAETISHITDSMEKYRCIKYLIRGMGYEEMYASDIKYKKIYITSDDTEETIKEKVEFAKKGLDIMPNRDMVITDKRGRRVHIGVEELDKLYEDIEYMIKCRIEREFEDVTRIEFVKDMGDKKER